MSTETQVQTVQTAETAPDYKGVVKRTKPIAPIYDQREYRCPGCGHWVHTQSMRNVECTRCVPTKMGSLTAPHHN